MYVLYCSNIGNVIFVIRYKANGSVSCCSDKEGIKPKSFKPNNFFTGFECRKLYSLVSSGMDI